jgi:hypothetical protein
VFQFRIISESINCESVRHLAVGVQLTDEVRRPIASPFSACTREQTRTLAYIHSQSGTGIRDFSVRAVPDNTRLL